MWWQVFLLVSTEASTKCFQIFGNKWRKKKHRLNILRNKWILQSNGLYTYGTKCAGRIVTKSMSYFFHLCDCSLPYCATLEAWNWFVAGQHLNASHPRLPVWPNQNVTLFSGNYFLKNFKLSQLLNRYRFWPNFKTES